MKKKYLGIILSSLSAFSLTSCGEGVGLITETYVDCIQYTSMERMGVSETIVVDDNTATRIEEKQKDIKNEFYFGLYYQDGTKYEPSEIKNYVKSHKHNSIVRAGITKTSPMTSIQTNHRLYNLIEKYLVASDSFKIEYFNLKNGYLFSTTNSKIYYSYCIYDIDDSFKNLANLFDGLEARRPDAEFVGWVDKEGNDIDFTKLKYGVELYAKWSDEK